MNPFEPSYSQYPWLTFSDPAGGAARARSADLSETYRVPQGLGQSPSPSALLAQSSPQGGWGVQAYSQQLPVAATLDQGADPTANDPSADSTQIPSISNLDAAIAGPSSNFISSWLASGPQVTAWPETAIGTFNAAAPSKESGTRLVVRASNGSTAIRPSGLDDGVYRSDSSPATFIPVAGSEDDEVAAENGENLSPQQMYRSYQFTQAAGALRQIEPNNPLGYRTFWGAPRDQDVEEIQKELAAAQARAWIREYRPDLVGAQIPDVRPTW